VHSIPAEEKKPMLALTQTAAEAVHTIVAKSELPDSAGLRLQAEHDSSNGNGPSGLVLDVVLAPDPDDTVVDGAPLYVDSAAADLLADQVLDAELEADDIRFSLRPQPLDDTD
jgi:Fe-S cluster assembly iron-binding protein IscA